MQDIFFCTASNFAVLPHLANSPYTDRLLVSRYSRHLHIGPATHLRCWSQFHTTQLLSLLSECSQLSTPQHSTVLVCSWWVKISLLTLAHTCYNPAALSLSTAMLPTSSEASFLLNWLKKFSRFPRSFVGYICSVCQYCFCCYTFFVVEIDIKCIVSIYFQARFMNLNGEVAALKLKWCCGASRANQSSSC